jgi:hypothetical protein
MRFLRECSHGWKPCTVTEHQDVVRQKTLQGSEYLPQFEDGRGEKRVRDNGICFRFPER